MPHILWAEDDPGDRMFIQAVLSALPGGPVTEFVDDGEALLARLESCAPDLVVLDLGMPSMGGLEVLAQLRQGPFAPPVVVFTGHEGEETKQACYRLGAREVVQKPVGFRDFRARVEAVVAPLQALVAA